MHPRNRSGRRNRLRYPGFTLVELIVTMIIISIMAFVAMPRFANRQTFETRGYADEVLSAVQYARKIAVANRRNVCASRSGSTLTLTMASLPGSRQSCNASTYVINPATGGNYVIQPPHTDVALTGSSPIIFDGQGRSIDASLLSGSADPVLTADATLTVTGDSSYVIKVAAYTGYVYVQ